MEKELPRPETDSSPTSETQDPPEGRLVRFWRGWLKPLLVIILVVSSFRSAIADWNDVPTGSMRPTILEGDRIFVNKVAYDLKVPFTRFRLLQWGDPERGEVVVLVSPRDEKRLVKRLIAEPGDRLAIRNRQIWLNGECLAYSPLDDAHLESISESARESGIYFEEALGEGHAVRIDRFRTLRPDLAEVVVPPGTYFVMGDNRDHSLDSRVFGFVTRERIVGRAQAVVLSVDPERSYRPRWERFFTPLR